MNSTLKSMLIAAAAITSVSAFAQDKATLDLLVKKGLITAEERAKTLDEAAKARTASGLNKIFVKEDATKRLTFSGRIQTQYESISGESYATSTSAAAQSTDINTAFMRRLYLGFKADMGEGISGEIVYNFADDTLDKAIFTAETGYGNFILGYQKVQWGLEENTSSSKLLTVERSASNRFWSESASSSNGRLGFGARHTGLHYANKYAVDAAQTLEYGASVANSIQGETGLKASSGNPTANNNDFGIFANVVYTYKVTDTNKHSIGVNYGTQRDSRDASGNPDAGVADAKISGFNPYIKSQFDKLIVQAEMISTTNEARGGSTAERKPEGYTLLAAYKFTDQIEGVVRYSQLDTDRQGASFGDLYRDAKVFASSANVYNKFDSYYVGVNYYFVDHNAKIMFGYEQAKATQLMSALNGTVGTGKADADIFRLQAQVLF
jgi:phosphate-selective porin